MKRKRFYVTKRSWLQAIRDRRECDLTSVVCENIRTEKEARIMCAALNAEQPHD